MKIKSTLLSIFYIIMALPLHDVHLSSFMVLFSMVVELFIILGLYLFFYRGSESSVSDRVLIFIFGIAIMLIMISLSFQIGMEAEMVGMTKAARSEFMDRDFFGNNQSGVFFNSIALLVT
ncbi:MAG: hypothetical protein ACKVOR_07530 [Flavobacteriales bacterium]